MSRRYRELKNVIIIAYGYNNRFPPYKMTLSWYKKFKRDEQRSRKICEKVFRTLKKGTKER